MGSSRRSVWLLLCSLLVPIFVEAPPTLAPPAGVDLWSYPVRGWVRDVAISEGGFRVAAAVSGGSADGIYVFDSSGDLVWMDGSHSVYGVDVSWDGERFVACDTARAYLFDPRGDLISSALIEDQGVASCSISISSDGLRTAVGVGNYFGLLDRSGFRLRKTGLSGGITSIEISWDAGKVAAGTLGGEVVCFEGGVGRRQWSFDVGDSVNSVALSRYGERVVAGADDHRVLYFDADSGELLWMYETGAKVSAVDISEDGSMVVAGTTDGWVYLFDDSGNLVWSRDPFDGDGEDRNVDVAISWDGSRVVAGSSGRVYIFDGEGNVLRAERLIAEGGTSVDISEDGSRVAVGLAYIEVLSEDSFRALGWVYSIATSPTGSPSISFYYPRVEGMTVEVEGEAYPGYEGASIVEITWDWGDGTVESSPFPGTHTYSSPGTYTIRITAVQSDGLSYTATTTVTVEPGTQIATIPPVTTPPPATTGPPVTHPPETQESPGSAPPTEAPSGPEKSPIQISRPGGFALEGIIPLVGVGVALLLVVVAVLHRRLAVAR